MIGFFYLQLRACFVSSLSTWDPSLAFRVRRIACHTGPINSKLYIKSFKSSMKLWYLYTAVQCLTKSTVQRQQKHRLYCSNTYRTLRTNEHSELCCWCFSYCDYVLHAYKLYS